MAKGVSDKIRRAAKQVIADPGSIAKADQEKKSAMGGRAEADAESPSRSLLGRIFGEGEDARNWQIWIIAIVGIFMMLGIYCFARQDRHADLALTFLIQAFTGAIAFFVGGKTRRR